MTSITADGRVAGMIIMSAYLIDVSVWQHDALYVVWYGLKSVSLFLFYLANLVLAMRVTPTQVAATSFSVLMSIGTMGFVIASTLLPALDSFGGFQAMFGVSALFVCLAGTISLLLSKEVRLPV